MNKNIKDVIHYYIGQPCTYDDTYHNQLGLVGKVTTRIILEIREPHLSGAVTNARLHLRRLEDMTEEEMIGLLQSIMPTDMEDKPTNDDYDLNMFYNDGGLQVDQDVAVGVEYSCRCKEGQIAIRLDGGIDMHDEAGIFERVPNQPQAFHYLLSKGFDLFGLIDAGLAIDTKTL